MDRETAEQTLRDLDRILAPTSETSIWGDALYSIRHDDNLAETVAWWTAAYNAIIDAHESGDTERENDLYDAINEGRFEPTNWQRA